MPYKRGFHNHETAEKPDIKIWVDQTAIPAKSDDGWTFSASSFDENGYLVCARQSAGATYRDIPGIVEGHLYQVTIVVQSVALSFNVWFGEVLLGVISTPGTYTYGVRPISGSRLSFIGESNSDGVFTLTTFEALDPIELERIPVL
jgi:hypothetical protein